MWQLCGMVHRGEIVEKVVRDSGYPIAKIAKRLGKSRRHVYNIFDNNRLNWDVIMQIGHIINHDFAKEFVELRNTTFVKAASVPLIVQEANGPYVSKHRKEMDEYKTELEEIRAKYIELLEKYNALLNAELQRNKRRR